MGAERSLRVLLCEPAGRGGIFHYTCGLAGGLAETGTEVLLMTGRGFEASAVPSSVRVAEVFDRYRTPPFAVTRAIRSFAPDIVHLQTATHPLLHLTLLEVARWISDPVMVVTAHNVGLRYGGQVAAWASRRLYRGAARVIVHGPLLAKQLVAHAGLDARRVGVIPHGCAEHLVSGSPMAPINGQPPAALFFGYIHPEKGLEDLIEVLPRVLAQVPRARLIVAGRPEMAIEPLRRRAAALGVDASIDWHLGYVDSEAVPDLFAAAHAVVLPYRDASQSGVIFLAGAFGRPVIATRVGALPDAIEDGRTGLLVPPGNGAALAEALRAVLSDPARARELGEAHRQRCRGEHGWQDIGRRTRALYEEARGESLRRREGGR